MSALEAHHIDTLSEHVEQLAYHAVRGELWQKAAAHSHQAGLRLAERSAYRDAAAVLEQALTASSKLPVSTSVMNCGAS